MSEGGRREWRVPAPERLRWAHWKAHSAVFNPISGETHLLSALPAELLGLLASGADSRDGLAGRLAELCEVPNDVDWAAKVQALLDSLEILDLIEPVDP